MKKKVTKSLVLFEADAFNGKISNESPMAKALIGKSLKDEVRVLYQMVEKLMLKL